MTEVYIKRARPRLTHEEAEELRKVTRERLPRIMEYDRKKLIERHNAQSSLLRAAYAFVAERFKEEDSVIGLFFNTAYAEWVTEGDCYKDDADSGSGFNGATFCCNCGMFCSKGCKWYDDCGTNSTKCNVDLGCLNSTCMMNQSAIWDEQTMVCGCG
ncbi:MAG: hypothetical protein GY861_28400 [bacterium]|nr:hypothetical protein [bacterium]